MANWLALAPDSATLKLPDAEPPTLTRRKARGGLVKPADTMNDCELGVMTRSAAVTTVGDTGTVFTTPLVLHVMLSFAAPGLVALKVKA